MGVALYRWGVMAQSNSSSDSSLGEESLRRTSACGVRCLLSEIIVDVMYKICMLGHIERWQYSEIKQFDSFCFSLNKVANGL